MWIFYLHRAQWQQKICGQPQIVGKLQLLIVVVGFSSIKIPSKKL